MTQSLAALTGLFALATAVLGFVSAEATSQKNEAQQTVHAQQSSISAAGSSISAASSSIASLQSQLAAPTASTSGPVQPTNRNSGIVTIASGTGFDFDGLGSTWKIPSGSDDVGFTSGTLSFFSTAVIIHTPATYDSCQTTGYGTPDVSLRANLPQGTYLCLKTNENRYVALKLLALTTDSIEFDAASFDPPTAN